jgi:hypothetical protein
VNLHERLEILMPPRNEVSMYRKLAAELLGTGLLV